MAEYSPKVITGNAIDWKLNEDGELPLKCDSTGASFLEFMNMTKI